MFQMMQHRAPGFVRSVFVLGTLVALASCSEPMLLGAVRTPPLDVAAVTLPDQAGDPYAMRAAAGELLIMYFGYTSCPDICPTTMADIRLALEGLDADLAERVTVAMVTVDPERDTTEVVAGYLGYFFDRAVPLRTDDPQLLRAVTDAFGVQFQIADHEPGESYDVAHTAITFVVDDTGTVLVEWPFGFEHGAMTSDLETLFERIST